MKLIYHDATKESLELFYWLVFGAWFVAIAINPLSSLSDFPATVIHPVSFLFKMLPKSLRPWMVSPIFLIGLKVLTLTALLGVIVNRFRCYAAILSAVLLTVHQALIRSFGFIHHSELALLYAVYVLAIFPYVDMIIQKNKSMSNQTELNCYAIPFIVFLMFMTCAYSFMGIHRFVFGGLDVFTQEKLKYWILVNNYDASYYDWNLGYLILRYPWLDFVFNLGFPISTGFELLAPFAIVFKRFRYVFLCVMLPFHVIIFLFMDIFFWENMILLLLSPSPFSKHRHTIRVHPRIF